MCVRSGASFYLTALTTVRYQHGRWERYDTIHMSCKMVKFCALIYFKTELIYLKTNKETLRSFLLVSRLYAEYIAGYFTVAMAS